MHSSLMLEMLYGVFRHSDTVTKEQMQSALDAHFLAYFGGMSDKI